MKLRAEDLHKVACDVLSGEIEGEHTRGGLGLDRVIEYNGIRFNYNSKNLR